MLYASRSGGSSRSVYPRAPAAPAASPACAARADASARSASVGISANSIRSRLGSPAETVTGSMAHGWDLVVRHLAGVPDLERRGCPRHTDRQQELEVDVALLVL